MEKANTSEEKQERAYKTLDLVKKGADRLVLTKLVEAGILAKMSDGTFSESAILRCIKAIDGYIPMNVLLRQLFRREKSPAGISKLESKLYTKTANKILPHYMKNFGNERAFYAVKKGFENEFYRFLAEKCEENKPPEGSLEKVVKNHKGIHNEKRKKAGIPITQIIAKAEPEIKNRSGPGWDAPIEFNPEVDYAPRTFRRNMKITTCYGRGIIKDAYGSKIYVTQDDGSERIFKVNYFNKEARQLQQNL